MITGRSYKTFVFIMLIWHVTARHHMKVMQNVTKTLLSDDAAMMKPRIH